MVNPIVQKWIEEQEKELYEWVCRENHPGLTWAWANLICRYNGVWKNDNQ